MTDVEVLAAMQGEWHTARTRQAVDARRSHEIALSVLLHMRYLADAPLSDAQWVTLTGPNATALSQGFFLPDPQASPRAHRRLAVVHPTAPQGDRRGPPS